MADYQKVEEILRRASKSYAPNVNVVKVLTRDLRDIGEFLRDRAEQVERRGQSYLGELESSALRSQAVQCNTGADLIEALLGDWRP